MCVPARASVLSADGQGLCDGATGEDPACAQEQGHGLAQPLHHALEQTLLPDHEEDPATVSHIVRRSQSERFLDTPIEQIETQFFSANTKFEVLDAFVLCQVFFCNNHV